MKRFFSATRVSISGCKERIRNTLLSRVYFGRHMRQVPAGAIVFFPCRSTVLNCGLAGLVSVKSREDGIDRIDIRPLAELISRIEARGLHFCLEQNLPVATDYFSGAGTVGTLLKTVRQFKRSNAFFQVCAQPEVQRAFADYADRLAHFIVVEENLLKAKLGMLPVDVVPAMTACIEDLKDVRWCLNAEILDNIEKVKLLAGGDGSPRKASSFKLYKEINAVLNSMDRLEVRGRDSAGISVLMSMSAGEYERFETSLSQRENGRLSAEFSERKNRSILLNRGISVRETTNGQGVKTTAVCMTYKVAAEIGSLGDNIRFIREQISADVIFQALTECAYEHYSLSSHTRWASVGAICEANCHPVDNRAAHGVESVGIIQACLNGDIDNHLALTETLAQSGVRIPEEITTDTKIIPLQIQKYIQQDHDIAEAFRLAVNDFDGSHAIAIQTDLAPGKLFLAQRGSGQAIFVGLADDNFMTVSEVYGFVEETERYIKLNGEKVIEGKNGPTQGQLFILNREGGAGLDGIEAMYYDGTPIILSENDIKRTELTTRDIDRQGFPHYFLKEISESPASVEKTLHNRWKIEEKDGLRRYRVALNETMVPVQLRDALTGRNDAAPIRRIYFVGQGTAGIAAKACADILNYYLNDPVLPITALKASELSGFRIQGEDSDARSMADTLVVAISQSGTTTDTNRTIDMVRARGAHSIAIVNRRDSDITFKVGGVIYTSSGRDIEMSVASTKAFYSQIIAGALLGLFIAELKGKRSPEFISEEILRLLRIPEHMRAVLADKTEIERSARKFAPAKTYWAAVGSGPNKAAADEIRIKLSELCYKTISSDYVEDKKHIDLSSEPLIIICAAGTKPSVLGDIIKDTAIFKAHKATPVVITDEGEDRFAPYADSVFHVPAVPQHLSPILNTLVGHLWGYYAALAIHDGSRFLFEYRSDFHKAVDRHVAEGLDVFEVILEKSFRETVAKFYNQVRVRQRATDSPMPIALASEIILLLKYLSGRLPASDFELDFGTKGTARKMLETFFEVMGKSINIMARPVDAIKHQAKTVTVGTSRIKEKVEGILFDVLGVHGVTLSQLVNHNIIVLKHLQGIVSEVKGAILYRIGGLNLLGELTDDTTIEVIAKSGILNSIPSRVEKDHRLKGTKRIIVRQGNVYIGKGRKDDRSIIVIPIISASPETPNMIEFLLLLNIAFKPEVPLTARVKALGGKYEHIKNIVQENNISWDDEYLNLMDMDALFGLSAEKIGEFIVGRMAATAKI
ncbi:MAG: SIS domain-containing protein [Desulfobacterales bacterium]|jgi:glucosamine--fructose-6-phosphate aminotransferase (isomerizing)|nr:SIS domain-containing protein [Desulfobacterales bacterium]